MVDHIVSIHLNNQGKLIGFKQEDKGLVQLRKPDQYRYNPRYFRDLAPLFSEAYHQAVQIPANPKSEAYAGAESAVEPNVTVFPSVWTGKGGERICPTSMGHAHAASPLRYVEIYCVVHGVAALLTDHRFDPFVEFTIACPGDFLPTESASNMTLFNLNPEEPLVLLDISSQAHVSSKSLQREIGPLALMCYQMNNQFSVQLNPKYIGRSDGFGVANTASDNLEMTFSIASLSQIAEQLTSEDARQQLGQLGIQVHRANNEETAARLDVPFKELTVQNLCKEKQSPLYQAIGG